MVDDAAEMIEVGAGIMDEAAETVDERAEMIEEPAEITDDASSGTSAACARRTLAGPFRSPVSLQWYGRGSRTPSVRPFASERRSDQAPSLPRI
jgi:hypothetical protein